MSTPIVPQRPTRSQNTSTSSPLINETPEVPPRPSRRADRSISRDRENYARSPLNDSPFAANIPGPSGPGTQYIRKPSVANLPGVGQEGSEYASLAQQGDTTLNVPQTLEAPSHTRNIAGDLPLHAPQASVSTVAARNQVAPVTRLDSVEASQSVIGKPSSDLDNNPVKRAPSASRAYQYRPPSAISNERPPSARAESFQDEEYDHGIPEIGIQAPLNPMAGDVQAPSPAPVYGHSTGIGFFNDSLSRQPTREHHSRRRSGQGHHLPPGSYGLHDHGIDPTDQFEKAWYQKHPEELARVEHGAYGPGMSSVRGDWVMSSDELNRLVRETSNQQKGASVEDMPMEEFAYRVASQTASRAESPELHSTDAPNERRSNSKQPPESPLRRSFNSHRETDETVDKARDKIAGMFSPGEEHREMDEYGLPILAEDEVAKNPRGEYLRPAVSPEFVRSSEYDEYYRSGQRSAGNSRPSSRPSSIHGHHGLSRFVSHDPHHEEVHTPLEEIEEYEPLFKDDDDNDKSNPVERLKRHDNDRLLQRFPSRDIWEDTPTSLQLETTVGSAEAADELAAARSKPSAASLFEHPDKERARKGETTEEQKEDFLQDYLKKHGRAPHSDLLRPTLKNNRFPSRDVWEDTPDSLRLETEIGSSPPDQTLKSPPAVASKPVIPPRPAKSKDISPTDKKAPLIPDRPKPQVPPRPARGSGDDQGEGSTMTKTLSGGSDTSERTATTATLPPATKPKPAIPSSSKFANRAGFLNDLNSRLQSGPPAPKPAAREAEPAPEEDKAPLTDARKGRARGPQRRKPADQLSDQTRPAMFFSIAQPWTVWTIPEETDDVSIITSTTNAASSPQTKTARDLNEVPESSPLATNTAGERLQRPNDAPSITSGALAHPSNAEMDARARAEEEATKKDLIQHETDRYGFEGDVPEPIVEQPNPLEGVASPPPDADKAVASAKAIEEPPAATTQDAPLQVVMSEDGQPLSADSSHGQ